MFFTDVFDVLCKLSADVDPNVQNAANLLDRLVKDIITESTVFSIEDFVPLLQTRLQVSNRHPRPPSPRETAAAVAASRRRRWTRRGRG